ncbi:MAG TPA: plastocyanin/azurin family copper-binding protein [Solirubrobacterales bacterium]|nr:plastocyanin/azurin family copper-binding protein [Solirubrobacterales bacterium]
MKRLFGVAVLAALALVLVLSSGGDVGPARAASTKCVWIKHTKRVVRHVKRHGKVRRVVTIKHYKSCRKVALPEEAPAPTTPTGTSPGSTSPSEAAAPASTPEPEANAVSITANDHTNPYGYAPSRKTVKSGELTVQLINAGEDEHNMDMEKVGPGNAPEGPIVVAVSAASKGASTPTTVDVEPGTYRMWCTLPGHAAKGMETTITVTE